MDQPKCEVCGQPATVAIGDIIRDGASEPDERDQRWSKFKPWKTHYFCEQHERPPMEFDEDGCWVSKDYEKPNPLTMEQKRKLVCAFCGRDPRTGESII